MTELKKTTRVVREQADQATVAVGEWYWVRPSSKTDDDVEPSREAWLGCVTTVGSNYVELSSARSHGTERVHFDAFDRRLAPAPDAREFIARQIDECRRQTQRLLDEVRATTNRLAIAPAAPGGGADDAMVLSRGVGAVDEYRDALVAAKDKTLPKLFEEIREINKQMGRWMSAESLPLEGMVKAAEPIIAAVKDRIFSVQLYAGLTERIEQIADGAPAAADEPIRLFQRRHYMDEECLARYEAGGMEFRDVAAFDAWLARPANRDRILPHPRSVVAFQVRRFDKVREFPSIAAWIAFAFSGEADLDKLTFLYLRNGDRLYRLKTAIEFGAQLFPDFAANDLSVGKVYADVWGGGHVNAMYTEHQLAGRREDRARLIRERTDALAAARRDGAPKAKIDHLKWLLDDAKREREERLTKWTRDSVYYDDIARHVKKEIDAHNRLVLVLQGVLDRSPVFYPHPAWKLWDPADFAAAFRLVYDDAKALTTGTPPDFEAYRARLNASIKIGSTTVGQERKWLEAMAARENAKYTRGRHYDYQTFRPYGDPGPGLYAAVQSLGKRGALFRWTRERRGYSGGWSRWSSSGKRPGDPIGRTFYCPTEHLLHVDAYARGDYRQFFDDPRTRADYLQWAPLLLAAEDWKANKTTRKKRRDDDVSQAEADDAAAVVAADARPDDGEE